MTEEKMHARIAALIDACRQIEQLFRQRNAARDLPRQYASEANRAEIRGSYCGSDPDARTKATFADIKAETIARVRAEGEAERDAELRRISLDLHALRELLPDMAAKASIELGCIARDLAAEAGKK